MTLQSTSNYAMFKLMEFNRPIDPSHVEKLKKSIKKKNLLKEHPIIVNKDFNIFDGQHRWAACKQLSIPLFYIKNDDLDIDDIVIMNNNRNNWTNTQYLIFFANRNYSNYVQLKEFMDKENLSLSIALQVLYGTRQNADYFSKFRSGLYEFPGKERVQRFQELNLIAKHATEIIYHKITGKKTHLKSVGFYGALMSILDHPKVDHETFLKNIPYKIPFIRPCTTRDEYYNMLAVVNNYRNKNPIELLSNKK